MKNEIRPALVLLLAFTLITGLIYPALVTGIAQLAFPRQAEGSLILRNGKPVGSTLIGQNFAAPKYFWSRPSATEPMPYNAAAGSGSNLGPLNPALAEAVKARIDALRASDPHQNAPIPVDLVTSSASGLDPHISPAAAAWQAPRVANARKLPLEQVQALIAQHTQKRQWGVLGEPRVNVLELNLALDALPHAKN
ncbi:MAG: potassium-transporting ATPase subunit KdpC [Betaproteobacteria bacterium]|nr:potassium-transporting ATPase subunit KdpC [Betaproteobacteria bacterium]